MKLIPLYSAMNVLLGRHDEATLLEMFGVTLIRNRRGHLKRAYLIQLQSVVDVSTGRKGMHKIQTLTNGRVHALIGVRGSD